MPYLYTSDNGPDADEYESNYTYFDDSNSDVLEKIEKIISTQNTQDPTVKNELERICLGSIQKKNNPYDPINRAPNFLNLLNLFAKSRRKTNKRQKCKFQNHLTKIDTKSFFDRSASK